jgi:hypothetical protein
LGTHDEAIAVTDSCGCYDWIAGTHRQVCWSHLRRDFQAMIDRGGAAEPIGRRLLRLSNRLFRWWDRLEADEDYMESCFRSDREGHAIPSLVPVAEPVIKVA